MGRILVTGADGFVGSSLCRRLQADGMQCVRSVRRRTEEAQFESGDIAATTNWMPALAGCNSVIHLAARVHVMNDVIADPLKVFMEVNCEATANLAKQAAASGVKRFVFVSSIKVNGESTEERPFRADDEPAPQDPYSVSKWAAECALREIERETRMEVVVVRPPLVYGPGVGANFRRLMQWVDKQIPLPFGAVRNLRSLVALDNLVDLLTVCEKHSLAGGRTFLVSDGHDVSTPDLIRMLAASMKRKVVLLPLPVSVLTTMAALLGKSVEAGRLLGSLLVDIDDTRSILGWMPPVSMETAIEAAVLHFFVHSGLSQG